MLGEITEKLCRMMLQLSTSIVHMGGFFLPNEMTMDVTTEQYAKEKYRIQHLIGKIIYNNIYKLYQYIISSRLLKLYLFFCLF